MENGIKSLSPLWLCECEWERYILLTFAAWCIFLLTCALHSTCSSIMQIRPRVGIRLTARQREKKKKALTVSDGSPLHSLCAVDEKQHYALPPVYFTQEHSGGISRFDNCPFFLWKKCGLNVAISCMSFFTFLTAVCNIDLFFHSDILEIPESISHCKALQVADFSGNPLTR